MAGFSFLILIMSVVILQTVYCGNNSHNNPNQNSELRNSHLSEDKRFLFENNELPSQEKTIEKRRLLFAEGGEPHSPQGREAESIEFSQRRRTNQSLPETETQTPEHQKPFNTWENKQIRHFGPSEHQTNFRPGGHFVGEPHKSNHNWGPRIDLFETRHWNGERHGEPNKNLEFPGMGNYEGRYAQHLINENDIKGGFYPGDNGDDFNRGRFSLTTFNDQGISIPESYNGDRLNEIGRPNLRFYNRNPKNFWSPNVYGPEKGVIINFTTECPVPKQLNNQMVHKFIFAPKPSVPEISHFQIPETALIPGQKMTPMYYL